MESSGDSPQSRHKTRSAVRRLGAGLCLLGVFFLPRISPARQDGQPETRPVTRHLGVVGFYNPRLLYSKYQQLVDYLTRATGDDWELAVTVDYQETDRAFCSGKLDVAYLGPFTYLRVHSACGAVPVVRLNTGGKAVYRSLIMVREDSPYRTLADLKDAIFAFGSPLSTSSHLVPRMMLEDAGLRPGETIDCRYLGHHERAARAVVLGTADACGVRDIVGERFVGKGLRILARSGAIPNFPLVVRPDASREFRDTLVEALVEAPAADPALREMMRNWDEEIADGFAPADEDDYRPVEEMVQRVFGARGLLDPPEMLMCGGGR